MNKYSNVEMWITFSHFYILVDKRALVNWQNPVDKYIISAKEKIIYAYCTNVDNFLKGRINEKESFDNCGTTIH